MIELLFSASPNEKNGLDDMMNWCKARFGEWSDDNKPYGIWNPNPSSVVAINGKFNILICFEHNKDACWFKMVWSDHMEPPIVWETK